MRLTAFQAKLPRSAPAQAMGGGVEGRRESKQQTNKQTNEINQAKANEQKRPKASLKRQRQR